MSEKHVKAKSHEEAIEQSGFYIGQPAKVVDIKTFGNVDGTWIVMAFMQVIEDDKKI